MCILSQIFCFFHSGKRVIVWRWLCIWIFTSRVITGLINKNISVAMSSSSIWLECSEAWMCTVSGRRGGSGWQSWWMDGTPHSDRDECDGPMLLERAGPCWMGRGEITWPDPVLQSGWGGERRRGTIACLLGSTMTFCLKSKCPRWPSLTQSKEIGLGCSSLDNHQVTGFVLHGSSLVFGRVRHPETIPQASDSYPCSAGM